MCTVNNEFSINEKPFKVDDLSVSGDNASGRTISATVYVNTYGYIKITTTSPILFGCSNPKTPSSGTIEVTGSGAVSASVTYNDCSSFQITMNGVSTVYEWSSY